jgi:hypothetical protein
MNIEAMERFPADGAVDDAQGIPLPAYWYIRLYVPMHYVSQPQNACHCCRASLPTFM